MTINKIKEGIYTFRSLDWDRRLFDELIPLPNGTTYNAYYVKGSKKNVLIDTADPKKGKDLIENIRELGIKKIDYVIANHAEQDHSGTIPEILNLFPEATVICTKTGKKLLKELLLIPENKIKIMETQGEISLGDKHLKFIKTPWVHWPETMVTYLKEEKILFSCDFFGSHLAQSSPYISNKAKVYEAAKRYYAEIMMPFREIIKKNIEKVSELEIDLIAPSHGPIHQEPQFILNAYQKWVEDSVKNEVVIPCVSMHGSTRMMVDYLIDVLIKKDITVKPFNLTEVDLGELAKALVDTATIIIASPTVLKGPHPRAFYAAYLTNVLQPKAKFASIIGSYGWGGKMVNMIKETLTNLDVELLKPVVIKGQPAEEDYRMLDQLADSIYEKHKNMGLIV